MDDEMKTQEEGTEAEADTTEGSEEPTEGEVQEAAGEAVTEEAGEGEEA